MGSSTRRLCRLCWSPPSVGARSELSPRASCLRVCACCCCVEVPSSVGEGGYAAAGCCCCCWPLLSVSPKDSPSSMSVFRCAARAFSFAVSASCHSLEGLHRSCVSFPRHGRKRGQGFEDVLRRLDSRGLAIFVLRLRRSRARRRRCPALATLVAVRRVVDTIDDLLRQRILRKQSQSVRTGSRPALKPSRRKRAVSPKKKKSGVTEMQGCPSQRVQSLSITFRGQCHTPV